MDQSALLRAILDEPEDDVHRLVYADWLDDHGDAERAEFVRVQVALAKLDEDDARHALEDRETLLLTDNKARWRKDLPEAIRVGRGYKDRSAFRRGFPVEATLTAETFLSCAERLFDAAPIEGLKIEEIAPTRTDRPQSIPDRSPELFASPHLARLRVLDLSIEALNAKHAQRLAACRHLSELRVLELGSNKIGDVGLTALAGSPNLPNLQKLGLWFNDLQPASIAVLLGSPLGARLRRLDLGGGITQSRNLCARVLIESNRLGSMEDLALAHTLLSGQDVQRLSANRSLANLRRLDLHCNPITEDGVFALARSTWLRGLRWLCLGDVPLTADGLLELAVSSGTDELRSLLLDNGRIRPRHNAQVGPAGAKALVAGSLPQLRELRLNGHAIGDEGAAALAAWPYAGKLERLSLGYNSIGDAGFAALAASPNLRNLVELKLDSNPALAAGVRALAEGPPFPRLRELHLGCVKMGDEGAIALARSASFPNLRELWLGEAAIGPDGGRALARSPHLGRIKMLLLFHNVMRDAVIQELRDRYGKAVLV